MDALSPPHFEQHGIALWVEWATHWTEFADFSEPVVEPEIIDSLLCILYKLVADSVQHYIHTCLCGMIKNSNLEWIL